MDATAALLSIAGLLASLPDESIENLLVTYDSLVGVSDEGARPAAALLLRQAAPTSARRERLMRAVADVEESQPCA